MAHELNDADEQILKLLLEGRNLPQNLADELGYSRQYIQNRLQMLKAADYASNLGGGLYEITDDGREEIGAESGADVDELRDALADARAAHEQVNGDALGEALERMADLLGVNDAE
ncbi:hypothetical protein EGH26_00040 [Halomicroarcula pellucida]|uniref:Winged helix-turn-helix DNA-binding n=2 Tax=Haloarcula pellucida TaxID=1427151 RepID=A0A830GHU4_9EURY|nr:hypothetical protein [Halomicroarcula pellucida]MBX0346589.1 hypothetical protein [Halomicroarcula pellucida]GGN84442.1 hypothetical protein GCM10009030_00080 [Halomicroarcula pellucida]